MYEGLTEPLLRIHELKSDKRFYLTFPVTGELGPRNRMGNDAISREDIYCSPHCRCGDDLIPNLEDRGLL